MQTPRQLLTDPQQVTDWMPLPGGELEAPRPRALCPACRAGGPRPLCLNCYRTQRERDSRMAAARDLDTATEARFQCSLPFEPVNRARLRQLKAARQTARVAARQGIGRYVDARRHAQIAARQTLRRLAEGLRTRGVLAPARHPEVSAAVHAAELQLPEAWLPFVAGDLARRS